MTITDPTSITGCALWLDPNSLSATHNDGDLVSSWADETANNNDASSSGTARPTFRDGSDFYHGEPTLEFSGGDDKLTVAADASLDNGQFTYAIVCRYDDLRENSDPRWLLNKVNTNASTVGLRVADKEAANSASGKYQGFLRLDGSESTVEEVIGRGPSKQAWTVLLLRYDGTDLELYVDEHLAATEAASGSADTDNSGALYIGNHSSANTAWIGHIAEVVVYDNAISDANRDDLIDWLKAKYPNSEYVEQGSILPASMRSCRIRTASETGLTKHQMLVVTTSGNIRHYDAPTTDPHNWTLRDFNVIPANSAYRTLDFIVDGGTWYVYVDRANCCGAVELWTGNSVSNLSSHDANPIIAGSPGDYVRTPAVIKEGTSWTMILDIRTDSVLGNDGHLDRWTSSDGEFWKKDKTNSPVLEPTGNGFEHSDVTHPAIIKLGTNDYLLAYVGYNEYHPMASVFPHEIGLATSTNLQTFTRTDKNPAITHSPELLAFDQALVANPAFFDDGTNLYIYYAGRTLTAVSQLGYAKGPLS